MESFHCIPPFKINKLFYIFIGNKILSFFERDVKYLFFSDSSKKKMPFMSNFKLKMRFLFNKSLQFDPQPRQRLFHKVFKPWHIPNAIQVDTTQQLLSRKTSKNAHQETCIRKEKRAVERNNIPVSSCHLFLEKQLASAEIQKTNTARQLETYLTSTGKTWPPKRGILNNKD